MSPLARQGASIGAPRGSNGDPLARRAAAPEPGQDSDFSVKHFASLRLGDVEFCGSRKSDRQEAREQRPGIAANRRQPAVEKGRGSACADLAIAHGEADGQFLALNRGFGRSGPAAFGQAGASHEKLRFARQRRPGFDVPRPRQHPFFHHPPAA